jgi:hypothetical protein
MEALLLVLDTLGMILLAYWSARNDRQPSGSRAIGARRYRRDRIKVADHCPGGARGPQRLP